MLAAELFAVREFGRRHAKLRAMWQEAARVLGRFGRRYSNLSLRTAIVGKTDRGYRAQRDCIRSAIYFGQGRIFKMATVNHNVRSEDHVHDSRAHQVYRQHILLTVPAT
jgi:hypothetical protein